MNYTVFDAAANPLVVYDEATALAASPPALDVQAVQKALADGHITRAGIYYVGCPDEQGGTGLFMHYVEGSLTVRP